MKTKNNQVTLKEFCTHFGCGIRKARECVAQGMPVTRKKIEGKTGSPQVFVDLEVAGTWIVANGALMNKNGGEGLNVAADCKVDGFDFPMEIPFPTDAMGLEASLERIKVSELIAGKELARVRATGDVLGTRAAHLLYVQAQKQLMETLKLVDRETQIGEQAWNECHAALKEWVAPVRDYLDALPRILGGRVNIQNPSVAEKIINDEIQNGLFPLMSGTLRKINHIA